VNKTHGHGVKVNERYRRGVIMGINRSIKFVILIVLQSVLSGCEDSSGKSQERVYEEIPIYEYGITVIASDQWGYAVPFAIVDLTIVGVQNYTIHGITDEEGIAYLTFDAAPYSSVIGAVDAPGYEEAYFDTVTSDYSSDMDVSVLLYVF